MHNFKPFAGTYQRFLWRNKIPLFTEGILPNIQAEPPLPSLRPFPLVLSLFPGSTALTPPEPPFLQDKVVFY